MERSGGGGDAEVRSTIECCGTYCTEYCTQELLQQTRSKQAKGRQEGKMVYLLT